MKIPLTTWTAYDIQSIIIPGTTWTAYDNTVNNNNNNNNSNNNNKLI